MEDTYLTTHKTRDHETSQWKWVVLAGGFMTLLIHSSLAYSAGVINVAVLEYVDNDTVLVAWLMSFFCVLFSLAAPLAVVIINFTDCRTCVVLSGIVGMVGYVSSSKVESIPLLFLTLGLAGTSHALSQTAAILVLSFYFPDDIPFVHGICLAGSGLGWFLHPAVTQILVDTFGFRGAMMLLGGFAFHSTAFGLLFRPTRLEIKSKVYGEMKPQSKWRRVCAKVVPPSDIFRIHAFTLFLVAVFLYSVIAQIMAVSLPSYIKTYVGLSSQETSVSASIMGGGAVVSRLFSGLAASDDNIGSSLLFFGMASLLSVLCFCGTYIMDLYRGPHIISFFFGVYAGGMFSLTNTIVVDIVGLDRAPHGFGVTMMVYGIGGLAGPPVLAWLLQLSGPQMLFIFCGVVSLLCAALALLSTNLKNQHNSQSALDIIIPSDQDSMLTNGQTHSMTKMTKHPSDLELEGDDVKQTLLINVVNNSHNGEHSKQDLLSV